MLGIQTTRFVTVQGDLLDRIRVCNLREGFYTFKNTKYQVLNLQFPNTTSVIKISKVDDLCIQGSGQDAVNVRTGEVIPRDRLEQHQFVESWIIIDNIHYYSTKQTPEELSNYQWIADGNRRYVGPEKPKPTLESYVHKFCEDQFGLISQNNGTATVNEDESIEIQTPGSMSVNEWVDMADDLIRLLKKEENQDFGGDYEVTYVTRCSVRLIKKVEKSSKKRG